MCCNNPRMALMMVLLLAACGGGGSGPAELTRLDATAGLDIPGGGDGLGPDILGEAVTPGETVTPGEEVTSGEEVVTPPDECGLDLNPNCEPRACKLGDGTAGTCGKDANGACACLPEQPKDLCSPELNPKCEPNECTLANGTVGKCQLDYQGACGCVASEPGTDPCDQVFNPNCSPHECDDGNKETEFDRCRFVGGVEGSLVCKCAGDFMPDNPCGEVLNPECKPSDCKLSDGKPGKCQTGDFLACSCQPEVVPGDPCGKDLNQQCEPKDCPLPDGSMGMCRKDAAGGCGCAPVVSPQDPCGNVLNPECKAVECDDKNPGTIKDMCRWVTDPAGVSYCKCVGEVVSYDPCSAQLNPQCNPVECKTEDGKPGRCKGDASECKCAPEAVPQDPCGKELNPQCDPKDCVLPDGTKGACKKDAAGGCGCAPAIPPQDPCGKDLNPKCEQVVCDDGNPQTMKDMCRWVTDSLGNSYCKCQGEVVSVNPCSPQVNPECNPADCKLSDGTPGKCKVGASLTCSCQPEVAPQDPCGKALNPTCEPKDCVLPDGTKGQCKKDAAGGCGCAPFIPPQDPCGKDLNPKCEQVVCDDGNPQTVKDVCRWVTDPLGNSYCKCKGEVVPQDPCAPMFNPECKPADCKLSDGTLGKCKVGASLTCSCQPEVVPQDPCGKDLNPTCEPKDCLLPDGTQGTCTKDAAGGCGCAPFIPPQDPCGKELNPQCEARACDDGDPTTVKDVCRWVKDPLGVSYCKCQGDVMPVNPCSPLINPECKPTDCKLPDGKLGKCKPGDFLACSCQPDVGPIDPCGQGLNPTCQPNKCYLPDGSVGTCQKDLVGGCSCSPFVPPQDPCSKAVNPKCEPKACDDGNPQTANDACVLIADPMGIAYCKCQGTYPFDPCNMAFNPVCKPVDCKTSTGKPGKCALDLMAGCSCKGLEPSDPCGPELNPECLPKTCTLADGKQGECRLDLSVGQCTCGLPAPQDPCGQALNPECTPAPCDDGDPKTVNDHCVRGEIMGIPYCKCQGFSQLDPCATLLNPTCEPAQCKLSTGEPGQCGLDPKGICSCQKPQPSDPCGAALNPECKPSKCDDGDPNTTDDQCVLKTLLPGIESCTCAGKPPVQDPCSPAANPQCVPVMCTTAMGLGGLCKMSSTGQCACAPIVIECTVDKDCLGREWNVDCMGHWDCLAGKCVPVCGSPCGNGKCEPDQGEGPDTCAPDCKVTSCKDNLECAKTQYCAKKVGDCDGAGVCTPRPPLCPLVFSPVCGCDKKTYNNACEAAQAGVNVLHTGACEEPGPCDLAVNPECNPVECKTADGQPGVCGTSATAKCTCLAAVPECKVDKDCLGKPWNIKCYGHWDCVDGKCVPTCGDPCGNGKCEPDQGEGPDTCAPDCNVSGCKDNLECAKTEYCAKKVGDCDGVGTCASRPTLCPFLYQPVCGCDKQTYINACEAARAGVNILYEKACEEPPQDPCNLSINPKCEPVDCKTSTGLPGKCGTSAITICSCMPVLTECTIDKDCLGKPWIIYCFGHWDCLAGKCVPKCGDPCGNGKCEPDQGEGPDTCAPDCKVASCKTNLECSKSEYCAKKVGDCDGIGACALRPSSCPDVLKPVCGCDKQTYDNSCWAAHAGVNVLFEKACDESWGP